ncbi:hypothetical protein [Aquibacillus sediminis]|uniref:hypothetical protein n=1 Tax=Aquibacillus sediminis TaxID=2574734 RepID=UPI0011094991|nr:hypothetical protein [Aquibacillus sediminis]
MDQRLKGLIFKEYRMMRNFYISVFLLQFAYFIFLGWNAVSIDDLIIRFSLELAIGLIILPATVLFSLNMEVNQMADFLHIPTTVHKKIFVKLFNATIVALLFFAIYTIVLVGLTLIGGKGIEMTDLLQLLLWYCISALSISVFFVAIILLLWSLHQYLKLFIGWGWSAVSIFIFFYVFFWGIDKIKETTMYDQISGWGQVAIPFSSTTQPPFFIGMEHTNGQIILFLGYYLFYTILILGAYFTSVFLIERKLEV